MPNVDTHTMFFKYLKFRNSIIISFLHQSKVVIKKYIYINAHENMNYIIHFIV